MFIRALVRVVNLLRVVSPAGKAMELLVTHARDHLQQLRILAEELAANVLTALHFVGLIFTIYNLAQALDQQSGLVACEQAVPIAAPYHFNDVPAGPAKSRLQFLDDLAVAAHRPVEALEVAIYHENKIVKLLA